MSQAEESGEVKRLGCVAACICVSNKGKGRLQEGKTGQQNVGGWFRTQLVGGRIQVRSQGVEGSPS